MIGFPDSYTREADYYWTAAGGMVKIPYDSAGKWTGEIETVEAPKWVASPYPGARQ
ncbi:hypothetical protein [Stenomitos frigidus]|uniref:hypothetical protein n=1 Tax=Stenomitos frigidus TaxID=1886765 RepID=UPI001C634299|nr:hypothetical protein [Stenomitos frigidus]